MPYFGRLSTQRLSTCDERLQDICNEAIKVYDFSVLFGHRDEIEQKKLFREGKSKLEYPHSKHNNIKSLAVDIAPYPIPKRWGEGNPKELARFYYLVGIIKAVAHSKNIPIRLGADWDGDGIFTDQSWDDLVHVEII